MFKRMLLLMLMAGMAASLFGREFEVKNAKKVTQEDEDLWIQRLQNYKDVSPLVTENNAAREEIGRTWYDYATNNIMGRTIAHAPNGLHVVYMKINPQGAERYVTYDYFSGGLFFGNQSVTEARRTGWGRVASGKDGEAIISLHTDPTQLWFDAGEGFYTFRDNTGAETNPGVFADFSRHGDTLVFITQSNDWSDGFFKYSFDYGTTWQSNPTFYNADTTDFGNTERHPNINPVNPSEITHGLSLPGTPAVPNGANYYVRTTDWGATWDTTRVHFDDQIFLTDFGETEYIIANFQQFTDMYTQNGTYHMAFGAVQGIKDTLSSTLIDYKPILYWNDEINQLVQINDTTSAAPQDTNNITALQGNYPGNGLGNAYVQMAEGPNGELLAVWQAWEADENGDIVLVFANNGSAFYATDIMGSYSPDGGMTWSYDFKVGGTSGGSDYYPNIPERFEFNGDSIVIDLIYMEDTDPGVSIFTTPESDPSEVIWYYERTAIDTSDLREKIGVGISNPSTILVTDFALAQNYPNPFNPSTTIEYSLKKTAEIQLDVYNLVGQKVATLVNGRKAAGAYTVNFDAQNLASGVYFYTLSSGSATLAQKMLLLK